MWWRACVIWQNRAVYYTGPILLASTLGECITCLLPLSPRHLHLLSHHLSLRHHWSAEVEHRPPDVHLPDVRRQRLHGRGSRPVPPHESRRHFFDSLQGVVRNLTSALFHAVWLTIHFETLRATSSLHRCRLKEYLDTSGAKTRVLKVLALFIESGTIYCAILVSRPIRAPYAVKNLADMLAAYRACVPVQLRKLGHPRRHRLLFYLRMPRARCGKCQPQRTNTHLY